MDPIQSFRRKGATRKCLTVHFRQIGDTKKCHVFQPNQRHRNKRKYSSYLNPKAVGYIISRRMRNFHSIKMERWDSERSFSSGPATTSNLPRPTDGSILQLGSFCGMSSLTHHSSSLLRGRPFTLCSFLHTFSLEPSSPLGCLRVSLLPLLLSPV